MLAKATVPQLVERTGLILWKKLSLQNLLMMHTSCLLLNPPVKLLLKEFVSDWLIAMLVFVC